MIFIVNIRFNSKIKVVFVQKAMGYLSLN